MRACGNQPKRWGLGPSLAARSRPDLSLQALRSPQATSRRRARPHERSLAIEIFRPGTGCLPQRPRFCPVLLGLPTFAPHVWWRQTSWQVIFQSLLRCSLATLFAAFAFDQRPRQSNPAEYQTTRLSIRVAAVLARPQRRRRGGDHARTRRVNVSRSPSTVLVLARPFGAFAKSGDHARR